MSQYLNIYLKHNNDFISLMDYSRSTEIYDEFQAPFESGREYSSNELSEIGTRLRSRAEDTRKEIQKLKERINLIPKMDGDICDKLNIIAECQESIDELKMEIEQLNQNSHTCYFLSNVVDNFEEKNSIWAGIEFYPNFSRIKI